MSKTERDIVEALAAADAPVAEDVYRGGVFCVLCNNDIVGGKGHAADCPWQMAREWVDARAL